MSNLCHLVFFYTSLYLFIYLVSFFMYLVSFLLQFCLRKDTTSVSSSKLSVSLCRFVAFIFPWDSWDTWDSWDSLHSFCDLPGTLYFVLLSFSFSLSCTYNYMQQKTVTPFDSGITVCKYYKVLINKSPCFEVWYAEY